MKIRSLKVLESPKVKRQHCLSLPPVTAGVVTVDVLPVGVGGGSGVGGSAAGVAAASHLPWVKK